MSQLNHSQGKHESLGSQCEVVQATAATKGDEQHQEATAGFWFASVSLPFPLLSGKRHLCDGYSLVRACPRLQCVQVGSRVPQEALQVSRQW